MQSFMFLIYFVKSYRRKTFGGESAQSLPLLSPPPPSLLGKGRVKSATKKKEGFLNCSIYVFFKDVHRRQKLTTDFLFKLCELIILVVNISISRKKYMLTVVSRGSF